MRSSFDEAIEMIVRNEWGRLLALLATQFRDLDFAEDALQEAVTRAVVTWPERGIPANPAAWLLTTARRVAIDDVRRARTFEQKWLLLETDARFEMNQEMITFDDDIPDERLRLIFTCCHPALSQDTRVMLTLRTLGGLTTAEIASALLKEEATVAQRISRAKRKIRDAGIPFQTPALSDLPERLDTVLNVLYLISNEGFLSSGGQSADRPDLAIEAIRLTRILRGLMPEEPEVRGLLALMVLNHARWPARIGPNGEIVTLGEQDRDRWHRPSIEEGSAELETALRMRRAGPFQLQAAISAVHCGAASSDATDWRQIVALYDLLYRMIPTPIVALNRAIAVAEVAGAQAGLDAIDGMDRLDEIEQYRLLHSTRADLLRRLGRMDDAAAAYRRALDLVENDAERSLLQARLESLTDS